MKGLKFKTNIKCMGCVAAVTPALDQTAGAGAWSVDLQHPDRLLTVAAEPEDVGKIVEAIKQSGYQATPVDPAPEAGHSIGPAASNY